MIDSEGMTRRTSSRFVDFMNLILNDVDGQWQVVMTELNAVPCIGLPLNRYNTDSEAPMKGEELMHRTFPTTF
jgi:hypothetical protein